MSNIELGILLIALTLILHIVWGWVQERYVDKRFDLYTEQMKEMLDWMKQQEKINREVTKWIDWIDSKKDQLL